MTNIVVPELGESVVEARVARWLKKEGDRVEIGEPVVELETEKIDLEVNAERGGVITSIKHKEGDDVKIGELLAVLDESAARPEPSPAEPASPEPAAKPSGNGSKATPTARNVAREHDVNLTSIQGSGAAGRVMKQDVEKAIAPPTIKRAPASPAPPAARHRSERPEERQRMSKRRATIARRLVEAQHNAAMLTTFNEIDMSAVEALRGRIKERIEKEQGVKLSVMPFFVKAACLALKSYPVVNSQIDGDSILYKHYVNMGIAVASDAGLVVPSIKDADQKGLLDIARDISAVAKKARDGKLTMEDLTGGTFTITNGGVFGSLVSTPILNYPQVGILGLHKIQERPMAIGGKVEIRPMMYVALTYDHRLIDGQQAVLFLVRVKELMEDPATMLVD
jgi:2-oxoglutarate dehydrogenase E2 component (dihydrolipoamide succinyltransferase)